MVIAKIIGNRTTTNIVISVVLTVLIVYIHYVVCKTKEVILADNSSEEFMR